MIGLSLAALVAGSLITLAVLAQRVTLDIPIGVEEIQPRRANTTTEGPPLVVAQNAPEPPSRRQPRRGGGGGPVIEDQVLPLRISQPATPARGADRKGGSDRGPDRQPQQRRLVAGLPPGIIKKVGNGGSLPPGHKKQAVAGAQPNPTSNGNGRGACGEPPCGNPHTSAGSVTSKVSSGSEHVEGPPGHSKSKSRK
jgi:hypothetical protein